MKAERLSTEINEAQLRVQFAEEMTNKDTEVASQVQQVVCFEAPSIPSPDSPAGFGKRKNTQ